MRRIAADYERIAKMVEQQRKREKKIGSPLLALSGHRTLHCTCLLSGASGYLS
jgi:hypothetical protein